MHLLRACGTRERTRTHRTAPTLSYHTRMSYDTYDTVLAVLVFLLCFILWASLWAYVVFVGGEGGGGGAAAVSWIHVAPVRRTCVLLLSSHLLLSRVIPLFLARPGSVYLESILFFFFFVGYFVAPAPLLPAGMPETAEP